MSDVIFHGPAHFSGQDDEAYRLLPFRFMDFDERKILVNEVGEHHFLDHATFQAFISKRLLPSDTTYLDLKAKHFLWDTRS